MSINKGYLLYNPIMEFYTASEKNEMDLYINGKEW